MVRNGRDGEGDAEGQARSEDGGVRGNGRGGTGHREARDGVTMGEILLRGGNVMLGYLKDQEETKKSMRDNGWFYTGDVGVMHHDGYLEVKDRSKDMIICGGENLSSVKAEVEAVLYVHPAINEAAVVARPDAFCGETTLVNFVSEE